MLDSPVWSALTTDHVHLAQVNGAARRYPVQYARFAALGEPDAWDDLRALVPAGDVVGLCTAEPVDVPAGWELVRHRTIEQMVCDATPETVLDEVLELGDADAGDMFALAHATDPGPYMESTHRLGRYLGVRDTGRLVAM